MTQQNGVRRCKKLGSQLLTPEVISTSEFGHERSSMLLANQIGV